MTGGSFFFPIMWGTWIHTPAFQWGFCTDDDDDLLYLYVLYGVLKTAVLPVAG